MKTHENKDVIEDLKGTVLLCRDNIHSLEGTLIEASSANV